MLYKSFPLTKSVCPDGSGDMAQLLRAHTCSCNGPEFGLQVSC